MKAVLAEAALEDRMEIARHIGKDDIPAARRFNKAQWSRAQAIGRNPLLYPLAEGSSRSACAAVSIATI